MVALRCKFPRGPASPRFVQIMEEDPQISEEEAEDREWIESLEYVIENSGRERASDLLKEAPDILPEKRRQDPLHLKHPVRKHHRPRGPAPLPRRLRDRAQHKKHHKVERHGHGGAREQDR